MDKKKIYIIVIVLCLAVTAGVLYYGFFSQPSVTAPPPATPSTAEIETIRQQSQSAGGNVAGLPMADTVSDYPAPRVFPQDTELDLDVYESAKFRALQDYVPLTVTPEEVGRDNPFAPYQ